MTPEQLIQARRRWALALIQRAQEPPPAYGTAAWLAMADGPEKVAAVVLAAEAHAMAGDELELTLRREVEALQRAYKEGVDDGWHQRRADHATRWKNGRLQPDEWTTEDIQRDFDEWASAPSDAHSIADVVRRPLNDEGGDADDVA